jgi:hypothetical protein
MEPRNTLTRRSNREETGEVGRQNKSDHAALTFSSQLEEIIVRRGESCSVAA